jgi:hypothetical protein
MSGENVKRAAGNTFRCAIFSLSLIACTTTATEVPAHGAASPAPSPAVQPLGEFDPIVGSPKVEAADVNGRHYVDNVVLTLNSPWQDANVAEYDLSRDWKSFKAVAGLRDDAPSDAKARFKVFGDGRQLYQKDIFFGRAEKIDINVTGVLRLKLEAAWLAGDDVYSAVWGEASLVK